MKTKFSIYILILSFFFISCSDGFLEGTSTDNIGKDEAADADPLGTAERFLLGAYTALFDPGSNQASHDDFGLRAVYLATDVMCDDITTTNKGFFFAYDYQNDNRSVSYRRTKSTWTQSYAVIFAANNALAGLDAIENPTEDEANKMEQLKAEALALRGYHYFILVNMFQQPYSVDKEAPGIPLYTQVKEDNMPGRNTVKMVYDLILSDLTSAYDMLADKTSTSPTKLNKYNVAGMLARVLPFVNDYPSQWKEVAKYADIASQGAALMKESKEFSSGFGSIALPEVLWGSDINEETNTFYASFMSNMDPYNIGYAGMGYSFAIASDLYNKIDPSDLRYNWFISDSTATKNLKKYSSVKFTENGANNFTSDYIYMKSGEMYYIKAEALYLAQDEAGARQALEEVMQTRLSGYSAADKSGEALLEEIRIQKRIDCWGEGVRLFDMKWRGEALDRSQSTNHEHYMKLEPNPKVWVYMIPLAETDANPEITENNPA